MRIVGTSIRGEKVKEKAIAARIVRIDRKRMESLIARHDYADMRVYADRNVVVRELFWRRLGALLALSRPPARERVMDFGGGNGVLAPTLSPIYGQVYCVDLRNSMAQEVAATEHLTNVTAIAGDLASLALPESSFDTIIAADVLEHIVDLPTLLLEFRRLLKPGGELLVSAPSENQFYEFGRRVFGYTKVADHYHDSDHVEHTVSPTLSLTRKRYFPVNSEALGVFLLARFERSS